MISQLLFMKILQLFIIMLLAYLLVKIKVLKSEDSSVLSKLTLYLFMPSVIINAFNMEITPDIIKGLTFSFIAAIFIHIILLLVDFILKKHFNATSVERASIIYSNAGNLIIPIVSYVFGDEWIVYTSAYLVVQLTFMWTHGVKLFSSDKLSIKKIILNVNIIAVLIGFIMLLTGIGIPVFVGEIISSLSSMIGPAGMIIAGMLMASVDFKAMIKNKRLYFVMLARLVICPVIIMVLLKVILMYVNINNAYTIMLISYFASITPSAAIIMLFAQIYGKDAEYATAINVVTTIGCIVTMPLLIMFF